MMDRPIKPNNPAAGGTTGGGSSGNTAVGGAGTFKITMGCEYVAAWLPVNNLFTKIGADWSRASRYWSGIMFQFGEYEGMGKNVLQEIRFKRDDGTEQTLSRGALGNDRYWINVVGKKSTDNREEPMTPAHIYEAGLKNGEALLNASFKPIWGGMTAWPFGPYTIQAEQTDHRHMMFTFEFERTDEFRVEVYKNGLEVTDWTLGTVNEIQLKFDDDGGDGDIMTPPKRPPGP